ncbi:hypothetical protein CDG77_30070 [Nostoc sp. 'Peltigera membranacea cyanobiont' 213]|uniref:DUF6615 family protein n=1 Tax=Nostoc sp. 'Peltigera membranacea cyanobiont' 213 TaxID=2014530 RepID=UPI000B956BDD|nr:DUF6615 family protein [Nostoc sp. 'Peltigera membranacea cyanobiont' 213]OYD87317.1 hypothetical protein CDG77_30070 [Nostoc sp. 'Peltigera membranacea cyanobiont' 213]
MDSGNHQPFYQVLERSLCQLGNTKAANQFLHFYIFLYMRPTLCDPFRSLSFLTWDMLAKGRSVDCQIGEETLTDINILELKIRHSSEIYTRTFSTTQEGSEGADWEWWFTGSSKKWIGFRVQAKVIDFETNSFEHLHYQNKNNPLSQCQILIQRAVESSSRLIPLYCLYSNWNNSPQFTSRYANYYPVQESYGCSILSAFAVRYLQSKKRKPANFKVLRPYSGSQLSEVQEPHPQPPPRKR